jgi:hypothetical protein
MKEEHGFDEAEISAKVAAGLTRAQAIEVLGYQRDFDAQKAGKGKKADAPKAPEGDAPDGDAAPKDDPAPEAPKRGRKG